MSVRKKLLHFCSAILFTSILQTTTVSASEIEYQERASDIIMNSLQAQTQRTFLSSLYKQLFFVPAWMHEKSMSTAAKDLFRHIKNDITLDKEGRLYNNTLRFEKEAKDVYAQKGSIKQKIELEFKISQLYEAYTNYAYLGSINWGAFNARISNLMVNDVSTEWILHRPNVDAGNMLEKAALGASLKQQLETAIPQKYHYRALQKKLANYRQIAINGGWPKVMLKGTLKHGKTREAVMALRERLRVTGDYKSCKGSAEGKVYNKCLQKAVKHFQIRNGLTPDAEVGPGTLAVLNKTVDERITTILLNLDRIKWLKKRTQKRRVIINIPDFMLSFEEDGKLIQKIKTIVGKPKNPTPIFSNTVKTIVLNPYWNLPKSIIQKEMIPKLLKNSNAMKKKGIEIRDGWGKNAKLVNPKSINWASYRYAKHVPFRFAQIPGPRNALGKIKFLFPNKFAVYMHDTPTKSLFHKTKRAFSHGCIRLQKPRELLKIFSKFNSNVDYKKSKKILKGKVKTYFSLKEQVPVDVIYLTSWVDYNGKLQFRNDIYGYDKMQLKSFRKW
jgi:murein L,D-transpeptidase YcbB/YkuD